MTVRLWQTRGVRVVLDTNILISACWSPGKLEDQVVNLALAGAFTVCVTTEVWAEYREVFSRPKFSGLDSKHVSHLLALIAQEAIMVTQRQPF